MALDIQKTITDAITYLDQERAREVLSYVAKHPSTQLDPGDQARLNYLRLTSIDEDRALGLMQRSILAAYTIEGYQLEQKLVDYLEQLEYAPDIMDFVYKLRDILSSHNEQLGSKEIVVGGKQTPPTIGNWLADYSAFAGKNQHDALLQVKYVNTSQNAKILSAAEKRVLQSLISIYDHLQRYIEMWELIPDEFPPDEQQELKRKLEQIFDSELPTAEQSVSEPVEPASSTPIEAARPVAPSFKIPLQKDLDLSTAKRGGLVFDQPTNVNLDDEMQSQTEKRRNELAIQAKLEALKQKQGINDQESS